MEKKLPLFRYIDDNFGIPFPESTKQAVMFDFTYSATRMGKAPTITGMLMWDSCLDDEWDENVYVEFNGEKYYIDKTPASSFSNTDARYKHELTLTSERVLLETTYFINAIVTNPEDERDYPVTNDTEFSFFGSISDFCTRFQESMEYSGIGLTNDGIGYSIVCDGTPDDTEEHLISFSDTYLYDALATMCETFDKKYYFDGKTIHIGDSNAAIIPAQVVIPTFEYGSANNLVSITKSNTSDKIVTRCTGYGSEDNIPYFYPNDTPSGKKLHYMAFNGSTYDEDNSKFSTVNYYRLDRFLPCDEDPTITPFTGYGTKLIYGLCESSEVVTDDILYVGNETIMPSSDSVHIERENNISVDISTEYVEMPGYGAIASAFKKKVIINLDEEVINMSFSLKEIYNQSVNHEYEFSPLSYRAYIKLRDSNSNVVYSNTYSHTASEQPDINISGSWYQYEKTFFNGVASSVKSIEISYEYDYSFGVLISQRIVGFFIDCTKTVFSYNAHYTGWKVDDGNNIPIVSLRNTYGIIAENPSQGDYIWCDISNALSYATRLLPPIYRETNGKELFYNAINNLYPKYPNTYYSFDNLHSKHYNKEHIERFNDIKPTIRNVINSLGQRIDKFALHNGQSGIAFDVNDTNAKNEQTGKYEHEYFYVKLKKTDTSGGFGFNLLDSAIDAGEMKISMSNGLCGGCEFTIMVNGDSSGTYNPVRVVTEDDLLNYTTDGYGNELVVGNLWYTNEGRVDIGAARTTCPTQQDTSQSEVWIALKKDNETFGDGAVMPNSVSGIVPTSSDEFVILNILLPIAYIREAEKRLYDEIISYMKDNNSEKWNFSLKFSRVFYEENSVMMDSYINESSKLSVRYNGKDYSYLASSYTYKMASSSPLPEVTINLTEKRYVKKKIVFSSDISQVQDNNAVENVSSIADAFNSNTNIGNGNTTVVIHNPIDIVGNLVTNGTNVSESLDSIEQRVVAGEASRTSENSFSSIAKRAELRNIFTDGTFRYAYNSASTIGTASKSFSQNGVFEGKSIVIGVNLANDGISFDQKMNVASGGEYTVCFWHRLESGENCNMKCVVTFYDSRGTSVGSSRLSFSASNSSYEQNIFSMVAPKTSSKADIRIISSEKKDSFIAVSGVMFVDGRYEKEDIIGEKRISSDAPKKFIDSNADTPFSVKNQEQKKVMADAETMDFFCEAPSTVATVNLTINNSARRINVTSDNLGSENMLVITNSTARGITISFNCDASMFKPSGNLSLLANETVVVCIERSNIGYTLRYSEKLELTSKRFVFGNNNAGLQKSFIFANVIDVQNAKAFTNER